MATSSFKLTGDKSLKRKLKMLGSTIVESILEEAVLAAAEPIQRQAEANAPRETGRLAGYIQIEVGDKSPGKVEVKIGPGKEGFYGKFVELGTVKSPPHPFLRPAVKQKKNEAFQEFSKVVREALETVRER